MADKLGKPELSKTKEGEQEHHTMSALGAEKGSGDVDTRADMSRLRVRLDFKEHAALSPGLRVGLTFWVGWRS